MEKPDAPSCERNREPILAVLRDHFADRRAVLEIGSGTGQHAVYFAAALPHLRWQASDRSGNLAGIRAWLDEAALPNTPAPIAFDVSAHPFAGVADVGVGDLAHAVAGSGHRLAEHDLADIDADVVHAIDAFRDARRGGRKFLVALGAVAVKLNVRQMHR